MLYIEFQFINTIAQFGMFFIFSINVKNFNVRHLYNLINFFIVKLMELINVEKAKKEVKNFYTKENIFSKTIYTKTPENKILQTMPYVHIHPQPIDNINMYPHVQDHQRVSHEILYNDHVFRNGNSNLALGYFSLR